MDVPAIKTKKLCPMEYSNNSKIPQATFPLLATMPNNTIRTGVAQGDENIPPKVCIAISTPNTIYHHEEDVPISLPNIDATVQAL